MDLKISRGLLVFTILVVCLMAFAILYSSSNPLGMLAVKLLGFWWLLCMTLITCDRTAWVYGIASAAILAGTLLTLP